MVDTRYNMKLSDLNSKPYGRKVFWDLLDRASGVQLYHPPGSEKYSPLWIDQFHGPYHINDNQSKNNEIEFEIIL